MNFEYFKYKLLALKAVYHKLYLIRSVQQNSNYELKSKYSKVIKYIF